jgi:carboxyl-terminal processing protease
LVYNYYLQHKQELEKYKSANEFSNEFNSEIGTTLLQSNIKDSFHVHSLTATAKTMIELRLKALLARFKWRNSGYYQVLNNNDTVVKKALEIINK